MNRVTINICGQQHTDIITFFIIIERLKNVYIYNIHIIKMMRGKYKRKQKINRHICMCDGRGFKVLIIMSVI